MTSSDITALIAVLISLFAFIVTFLTYRRERSKSNQDLIFQEKIAAYKQLIFHANNIFECFFKLVDDIEDHKGSKSKWAKYLKGESENYDDLVTDYEDIIFEYLPILPDKVYHELNKFGIESRDFIDFSFKGNVKQTIKAHAKLEKSLNEIISLVRNDLNVDKLNIDLKKRLK